ncbi:hypothetical protein B0H10DRAFT_2185795 [Mycena sp. CBHHK59/15]|nr:hypothetical protein B0H10DRAFT_2185795 [Mycena sp. CBHHK59/15]
MTNFPPATNAPTLREQVGALIITVNKLVARANSLSRMAIDVQGQLNDIQDTIDNEAAADNVFVRGVAKDPAQVEAEHTNSPDGSCSCWVVYIGREPGIYFTIEEADAQVKGCPNQQYRRRCSKAEALLFYKQMFHGKSVQKWVELFDDESDDE